MFSKFWNISSISEFLVVSTFVLTVAVFCIFVFIA